jgi:acylphosphatase
MTQDSVTRARIVVDGAVQGVGFRYNVRFIARNYNLVGYVKNLEDGTVEIVCEGTRSNIDSFATEVKNMKEPASIDRLDITFEEPKREFRTFKVVTGELGEEMVEGFSTAIVYMNKTSDDLKKEIRGQGDRLCNEISEVKQEIVGVKQEIVNLRNDLKAFMDERFESIEKDISEIKSRLGMT